MLSSGKAHAVQQEVLLPEIQVDQVVQDELDARNRWISANELYKNTLDLFKKLLSLPPDAQIKLDQAELEKLIAPAQEIVDEIIAAEESRSNDVTPPADAEIEISSPDKNNAGPMEIDEIAAIKLGLNNRLDLRKARGEVYDAQRAVVVTADALGAELTLFGSINPISLSLATSLDTFVGLISHCCAMADPVFSPSVSKNTFAAATCFSKNDIISSRISFACGLTNHGMKLSIDSTLCRILSTFS